jgi:uncharacterized protein DUF6916
MELSQVTLEVMKPLEGKTFTVSLPDGGETKMTLEEVVEHPVRESRRPRRNSPPKPSRTPFSLFFLGDHDPVLPQGCYDFRVDDIVVPSVFTVPVGRDESGTEYEVVFT